MITKRKADVQWNGDLKEGKGHVKTGSGAVDADYSLKARAESAPGTNPEELLGAAHSACFSMAFAHALAGNGTPPESLQVTAAVTFRPGEGIAGSHLLVSARIPGISEADFARLAEEAKANCPVSQALAGIPITLEASLA
jgi:lipoyl-dependent peroxiredoxin